MQIPWSFRILGLKKGPSKRALQHAAFLARTPNPILKARRYEAATAGGTRSYREVALDFGVTREEVCQYLALLKKLPAELVESLAPDVLRRMSYRRLLAQARNGPISAYQSMTTSSSVT
jgi:ParB-like chromosome segregation protein Spo0J